MKTQNIDHLKGEIEFRKLLAEQHVTGKMLLPDYYDKEQHDRILLERINTTAADIRKLAARDTVLSPFLELGAERCQRSLVLANDFGATGCAVDISYHQLQSAGHFARLFDKPKLPLRVCCDVNHLPFRNNSFPFAFCYEFLHHFPSPRPVLEEIYRVLANGVFFFSEEPYKRPAIPLYKQRHKIYSQATLRKSKMRRFLEKYISEDCCDEREHGIIENDDITLRDWIKALAVFDARTVHISSIGNRIRTELGAGITLKNLPNLLLGGGISGICTKNPADARVAVTNLADLFVCPDCLAGPTGSRTEQPPLEKTGDHLRCPRCGSSFPVIEDVTFLLPTRLMRELYPEFAGR